MGAKQFPEYLRTKGYVVNTIEGLFGRPDVLDTEWIETAGRDEWIVFTKDNAIAKNTAERNAVIEYKLKMVCLVHPEMGIGGVIDVFEKHWKRIERRFEKPPPWILKVSVSQIKEIKLVS